MLQLASSTTKPFALYRFTGGADTEAGIADAEAIGFDYGINENSEIGVVGFSLGIPQRRTDVPNVGQRSTSKPATSLVAVPITIEFVVNEKVQDNPKPLAKLMKFSLEDQTVRGTYSQGRFGLRADDINSLPTIDPVNDAGIKFVDFNFTDELEWSDHQTGQIQLEFVGAYTAFVTLLTAIINA